jgi:rhodanese-related sulfurtransferase
VEDKVLSMEVIHIEDVPVEEVWSRLKEDSAALLIDVRTRAEWAFVGLPDLSEIGKRVLTVEWQTSPESRIDSAFKERLGEVLDAAGADKDTELFFICRSGGRSRMAAEAMANAGVAETWRTVSRGLSTPTVTEGRSPAGRPPAWLGCRANAPV